MWEILVTDQFQEWFAALDEAVADAVGVAIDVLEGQGPALGRPLVDRTGQWSSWYAAAVPLADELYDEYLRELHDEGTST